MFFLKKRTISEGCWVVWQDCRIVHMQLQKISVTDYMSRN